MLSANGAIFYNTYENPFVNKGFLQNPFPRVLTETFLLVKDSYEILFYGSYGNLFAY